MSTKFLSSIFVPIVILFIPTLCVTYLFFYVEKNFIF